MVVIRRVPILPAYNERFQIYTLFGVFFQFGPILQGCMAQNAFQRNWYPDPIAGLFSYQSWNGMDGFWQVLWAIQPYWV